MATSPPPSVPAEFFILPPPPAPLTLLGTIDCDGSLVSGSTSGTGSTVSNQCGVGEAPDVAYMFTLTEPAAIELSTCDSSFDTWLHLYTADMQMLGEQIASCDDCGSCASSDVHTVLSSAQGTIPSELPAGAYLKDSRVTNEQS